MYSLKELGWNDFFASQLAHAHAGADPAWMPARVSEQNRQLYRVLTGTEELLGELSGKLRHAAAGLGDLPAVGDWVLISARQREGRATIHHVLPRRSKFSRKVPGRKTEEQVVAANVDVVFLVTSLNRDFNPRRMERYLSLAWESGARPIVVLNKCDLAEDGPELQRQAESAALGVPVLLASATRGDGIGAIRAFLPSGMTGALLGSSGVGKSSLINAMLGAGHLPTNAVREGDDRGRHTTTSRQLVPLPGGGLLMDTPGMRELQLWDAGDGIAHTFADVAELAARCRFRDCSHHDEPGCAVRSGVDHDRLQSFHKLEREEAFLNSKQDAALRSQRSKEVRRLMKSVNKFYRDRGR